MISEKSCGAIVLREGEGGPEVLLLRHRAGHWDFPKGHVEEGESEEQTALREVKEESGLSVAIEEGFRGAVRYSPYPGCEKEVVFFLASPLSGSLSLQQEEVSEGGWFTPEEALKTITYDSSRGLLLQAMAYRNGH